LGRDVFLDGRKDGTRRTCPQRAVELSPRWTPPPALPPPAAARSVTPFLPPITATRYPVSTIVHNHICPHIHPPHHLAFASPFPGVGSGFQAQWGAALPIGVVRERDPKTLPACATKIRGTQVGLRARVTQTLGAHRAFGVTRMRNPTPGNLFQPSGGREAGRVGGG
jgi:hypothetical protein